MFTVKIVCTFFNTGTQWAFLILQINTFIYDMSSYLGLLPVKFLMLYIV